FPSLQVERIPVILGYLVDVIGLPTRLKERHDAIDFLIRDERTVDTGDATTARHVEHVAAAQELLRTTFPKDGAAIDLRCHLKDDSGGKIRFDGACNNINRRALSGHDNMNTGGASHLRQPLDCCFYLLAGHQHQIRHLVNDDDD